MKFYLVRIYFGLHAHLSFSFLIEEMNPLQRISLCRVGERTHLEELFMKCSWHCQTAQVNCRQHCLLSQVWRCTHCWCKGSSISYKAEIHLWRVFMAEISMFESYLAHIKDGRNCPFGKGVTQGIWSSNEALTKVQFDLASLKGNKAITGNDRKWKRGENAFNCGSF